MRHIRALLVPLALAATAAAIPAPAAQAARAPVGRACGAAAATVANGSGGNRIAAGVVSGGPIVVDGLDVPWISISCVFQVNQSGFGAGIVARVSFVFGGNAGAGAAPAEVRLAPTDRLFLCTRVLWGNRAGATSAFTFDADPAVPGEQCARAMRAGEAVLVEPGPGADVDELVRVPGTKRFAVADVDGDGDPESFVTDPTQDPGRARHLVPEADGSLCDTLPEPQATLCRRLLAICDTLSEPERTTCIDIVRSIFFTTIGVGTGRSLIAELSGSDVDLDGEFEVLVTGAGQAPPADLDADGDADVVWRA